MSWIEHPGTDYFQGLDLTKLKVDQAYVNVTSSRSDAWLYTLSDECYRCPYSRVSRIGRHNAVLTVDVVHGQTWRILSDGRNITNDQNDISKMICETRPEMGEFGVYNLKIEHTSCEFSEAKQAVNIYLPILVVFLIIMCISALCKTLSVLIRYYKRGKENNEMDKKKVPEKQRVRSLDTFRGMSMVLMIFVNDGQGRYWWLDHATWNGLGIADLVFPFFLWIMGVCIPMSIKSVVSKNVPKRIALWNIFQRSCKLFLIGVALGSQYSPTLDKLRIFGVLQRFGIAYYVVASIGVLLAQKPKEEVKGKFWIMFRDVTELAAQWLIMIAIMVAHLLIIFLLPVPGCPTGYLGVGGKQDNWRYKDCIGGATKYVDTIILGENHLFQNPTAKVVYNSGSFDPEGILGCLLSIFHVFIGVQAGNILIHHKKDWRQVVGRWLTWAAITGIIGGVLCNFSQEDGVIPVNKNLWSLSYVLVTSCFAFVLLSACYILVDVLQWWSGTPFIQPGQNAIVMYVCHSIGHAIFPFHWRVVGMRTHFIFLLESTWTTLMWILVAFIMAEKKIFITV